MTVFLPDLVVKPRSYGALKESSCDDMHGSIARALHATSEGQDRRRWNSCGLVSCELTQQKRNFSLPLISASQQQQLSQQKPNAPSFTPVGGSYDEQVVVRLEAVPRVKITYTVEEVMDSTSTSLTAPAIHGHAYRKPFVLDRPGFFSVQAIATVDEWGLDCSAIATALYIIRPNAPSFITKGGVYKGQVTVSIDSHSQSLVHYMILDIKQGTSVSDESLNLESCRYQGSILLDKDGEYIIKAASFAKTKYGFLPSIVVESEVYKVESKTMGERLRALPVEMVHGVLRISGATEAALAPKLQVLRGAIAAAANTVKSRVHLDFVKKSDKKADKDSVQVGFSVEVEREQDAQQMVARVVDPSLVKRCAAVAGISVKQVTVKAASHALDEVLLSLGWVFPGSAQGGRGNQDYLDGSCLVYSEDRLVDVVDYRGAQSVKKHMASSASLVWSAGAGDQASILHSGDVMENNGGSHVIRLKLSSMPAFITDCFFALSAYNCRDLSLFEKPTMRLFDAQCPGHELCTYKLQDAGSAAAVVICSLSREKGTWAVRGFNKTCDATVRDYAPMQEILTPIQEVHAKWRRRRNIVLLAKLWHADRALPRGADQQKDDVLIPLLELPSPVFRAVVQFL